MASVENSVEDQVFVLSVFTIASISSVVLVIEFSTSTPGQVVGHNFTSSPVADEILITVIDQDIQATFSKVAQIFHQIGHKVHRKEDVDGGVAFSPRTASDIEDLLDASLHQESIDTTEVVAKRRISTGFSDVIDVELEGLAGNSLDLELAGNHSGFRLVELNEGITDAETSDQTVVHSFVNEVVFVGKGGVCGILVVNGDKTVTNTDTLEVQVKTTSSDDVGGDSGNVMSSVRFTSDVEISALVLREFVNEFLKENIEISGDLSFVLVNFSSSGVASAQRLINVEDVSNIIPWIRVDSKGFVIRINLERTIFGEKGDFAGATGTTSEPDDQRILGSISSGFEKPEEKRSSSVDGQETGPIGFVQEDGVSGLSNFSSGVFIGHREDEANAEANDESQE
jgi:hypothetical protein